MSTAGCRPSVSGQQPEVPAGGALRLTANRVEEAEQIVSEALAPRRIRISNGSTIGMELFSARVGNVAAGRLSYGRPVLVSMEYSPHFIVNVTLRGQAASRSGSGAAVVTRSEEGVLFAADEPLVIQGSPDCEQLSLVIPKPSVERELERLLGTTLTSPLRFDLGLGPQMLRLAKPALQMLLDEFRSPAGLVSRWTIGRHLEGLITDAMLLAQPHNYTELLTAETVPGPRTAITEAAELLRDRPAEPWSVATLAQAVHLSVRALQYGFKRDYDTTPMAYLRSVRLSEAREALRLASPANTTVREIALSCGFMHMSRFAAAYRAKYGESPSATLSRRSDLRASTWRTCRGD